MLKIRLQRTGKKKQAHFRVVLQERTWKTKGKYLELLGTYDPHAKELKVDRERIEHWLSQGAQISPTVNNLMVNHNVWDREKVASWKPKVREVTEGGTDEQQSEAPPAEAGAAGQQPEAPAEEAAEDEQEKETA